MILTMATRKAFQHSGSQAKLWRMTSSRARQPTADISDGRTCLLDLLIFLWKMEQTDVHICPDTHTHKHSYTYSVHTKCQYETLCLQILPVLL